MKQDLVTGKIKSIDRNKGRIEIYLKNGLTTTASYLYDIATLRENMNVLVALVNGSYVILNQVENVPRVGTSYSVRRPIVIPMGNNAFENIPIQFKLCEPIFLLDFEGPNPLIDKKQGIGIDYLNSWNVQEDWSYLNIDVNSVHVHSGNAALRFGTIGDTWYYPVGMLYSLVNDISPTSFIYKVYFYTPSVVEGILTFQIGGYNTYGIEFQLSGGYIHPPPYYDWSINTPNRWDYGSISDPGWIPTSVWNEVKIVVWNSFVSAYYNEVEIVTLPLDPGELDGIAEVFLGVDCCQEFWIDNVSITNL